MKIQISFTLLIFLIIYQFSTHNCQSTTTTDCYLKTKSTNSTWKLVWEDNFEDENLENWDAENESEGRECHGNWIQQESCNRDSNAQVQSGFLVLQAKREPYNGLNFTSATISSRIPFSYGRVEIRATQPIGHQLRTSISTKPQNETYWHELGQIEMVAQRSNLYRAVYYANSNKSSDSFSMNDGFEKLSSRMSDFHLYGFEWDSNGLKFFFDDIYTGIIKFNETQHLNPSYYLKLQIGVGLKFHDQPVPQDFNPNSWKCPNFIIDYVRFYTKAVFSTRREILLKLSKSLKMCEISKDLKAEKSKLDKICRKSIGLEDKVISDNSLILNETSSVFLIGITIGIVVLVLFIVLIVYVLIKLKNVQSKVHEQSSELNTITGKELNENFYLRNHGQYGDEGIYSVPEYEDIEPYSSVKRTTSGQSDYVDNYGYVKQQARKVTIDIDDEYVPIKSGK